MIELGLDQGRGLCHLLLDAQLEASGEGGKLADLLFEVQHESCFLWQIHAFFKQPAGEGLVVEGEVSVGAD